jgi:hypothetical protein
VIRARSRPLLGAALGAMLLAVACGAPTEARSPASRPPAAEEKKARDQDADGIPDQADKAESGETRALVPGTATATPQTGSSTTTTPAPQPGMEPADAPRRREAALRAARTEVDQAQRELETSMSDCAQACRALGSMERATGHLCDLAVDRDDRRRCEDSKAAVLRARERIRASCASCPGGPSLEKTAPIPSRP